LNLIAHFDGKTIADCQRV